MGVCTFIGFSIFNHPQLRTTLIKEKLLSQNPRKKRGLTNNRNACTIARTQEKALWLQGKRDMPRLAWLAAPASAFVGATKYIVDMQNTTCNCRAACYIHDVDENARSSTLRTRELSEGQKSILLTATTTSSTLHAYGLLLHLHFMLSITK